MRAQVPLIFAVYVGIAEAARALALGEAMRRRQDPTTQRLVGEMENGLRAARLALRHMLAVAADGRVSEDTTNQVLIGRTLAAREAIRTVDQGARYHPVREPAHVHYTGRLALGLDVNG